VNIACSLFYKPVPLKWLDSTKSAHSRSPLGTCKIQVGNGRLIKTKYSNAVPSIGPINEQLRRLAPREPTSIGRRK